MLKSTFKRQQLKDKKFNQQQNYLLIVLVLANLLAIYWTV